MKKLILLALCISMIGVCAGCDGGESPVSSVAEPSSIVSSQEPTSNVPMDVPEGTLGDFDTAILTSPRKTTTADGKSVLIVRFSFTNNSDQAVMFNNIFDCIAYQDGNILPLAQMEQSDIYDPNLSTQMVEVGQTLEVPLAYTLLNETDIVKIQVKLLDDENAGRLMRQFALVASAPSSTASSASSAQES